MAALWRRDKEEGRGGSEGERRACLRRIARRWLISRARPPVIHFIPITKTESTRTRGRSKMNGALRITLVFSADLARFQSALLRRARVVLNKRGGSTARFCLGALQEGSETRGRKKEKRREDPFHRSA